MPSILFVCTRNLCRSPFAQAFFTSRLLEKSVQGSWLVESAGTWTRDGSTIPVPYQKLGNDLGIDLRQHRSQSITSIELEKFDVIVVMEKGHKEAMKIEFPKLAGRMFLLTSLAGLYPYDIPDPTLDNVVEARGIVRGIQNSIDLAFDVICQKALTRTSAD